MSEPELTQRSFSAAEEQFFQQGEALESGEGPLADEPERRPRRRWRPTVVVVGCVCLALLGLSLAGGSDPAPAAVAAVRFVPETQAAPQSPPEPAPPVAAAAEPAVAIASGESRPARKKHHKAKAKRSHRRR
jgi:hypothetical protein